MLTTTKNITLQGQSVVDGHVVVYLSASIITDSMSSSNVSQQIANQDLYNANRSQIRKDISDFQNKVYEIEDALVNEMVVK